MVKRLVRKTDKSIDYVKATMSFEGLDLPDDILEVYEKYLSGEYSEKKMLAELDRLTQEEIDVLRRN